MLTAAIYARYSSELQRPTSIEDQVRLCREAAPRFECVVTDGLVYTDAEISGASGQAITRCWRRLAAGGLT